MSRFSQEEAAALIGPLQPVEHTHIVSDAETATLRGGRYALLAAEADGEALAEPEPEDGLGAVFRLELEYWERESSGANTVYPLFQAVFRQDGAALSVTAEASGGVGYDDDPDALRMALARARALGEGFAEGRLDGLSALLAAFERP